MAEKYLFFDGKKFTRDDKTGYYLCSTGDENNVRKRMHVYVWEYFNGPISKGYHIHHIDGDKSNNDIQTLRKNMAKATVMAKEWHNSNEGHEWHKKHYEQMKEKLHIPKRFVCEYCNKEFVNTQINSRFCSNKCKSAWRRMILLKFVLNAVKNILQTNIKKQNIVHYVKIKSIKPIGKADVYNMEVKNHHNFSVCGGFIVHNCMDAARYFAYTIIRRERKWS